MNTFLPAGSFVGFTVPGAIDASFCASLLDRVQTRGFSATGLRYPDDYRNNDRLVFDDAALAARLYGALGKALPPALEADGSTWQLEGLNSRFRACRYQGGQGFCVHRDGPYVPSAEVRSLLTVQLYLDDVPERVGGHTRFYADMRGTTTWASIPPSPGTAIVFDHRVWHDGEAVSAGIKHVLRTDAMYRRVGRDDADTTNVLGRHRGYVWQVIVRANGDVASAGRDGTVRTWGKTPEVTDLGLGSVTALHEGRGRLWAGTRSGCLAILDEEGGFRRVATVDGAVLALAHRAGGVVVSTASGALHAYDESGAAQWTSRAHESWAWRITPYGVGWVSVGQDGRVCFTTADGETCTLATLAQPLRAVAVSGDELWVGDVHGDLHQLKECAPVVHVEAHDAAITSIVIAEQGVFTGSEDGSVKCWRGGTHERCTLSVDFVTCVTSTANSELVYAGYEGNVFVSRSLYSRGVSAVDEST
ncbi:MAG: 2OG-Fe(II) oxygenase [Polyangiales bacterium]